MATESSGAATTGDETVATAGTETAANGGIMRTKVRIQSTSAMLKRWWGRLEKRRMATESGGDETEDETGGPRNETGDKTAATAGDEQDDGARWDNVYERRGVRI